MTYRPQTDFNLDVARGLVSGQEGVNKFGRNPSIAAATREDLWTAGGLWVPPTTARLHDIASTDVNDDGSPVGTGARTIRVFGLTAWGTAEVSEDIIMDGTTNVPTVNSYVIIHRMIVLTVGSTGGNVGVISATAQTDATVTAEIAATNNQTQMAIYGIPSTQTLYLTGFDASIGSGTTDDIDAYLSVNFQPDVALNAFRQLHRGGMVLAGTSEHKQKYSPYQPIPGPAIIKMQAIAVAAASLAEGSFDGFLVDN